MLFRSGYENLSGYTKHGEMRPAYSIIHPGKVRLHCILENDTLSIEVSDQGKGIEDVARAMEPLFTTKPELERSGMGFAFMEAFMDELEVESIPGKGTRVHMWKKMRCGDWIGKEDLATDLCRILMISLREFSKQVRLVIRRDYICRRLRIKFNYY